MRLFLLLCVVPAPQLFPRLLCLSMRPTDLLFLIFFRSSPCLYTFSSRISLAPRLLSCWCFLVGQALPCYHRPTGSRLPPIVPPPVSFSAEVSGSFSFLLFWVVDLHNLILACSPLVAVDECRLAFFFFFFFFFEQVFTSSRSGASPPPSFAICLQSPFLAIPADLQSFARPPAPFCSHIRWHPISGLFSLFIVKPT